MDHYKPAGNVQTDACSEWYAACSGHLYPALLPRKKDMGTRKWLDGKTWGGGRKEGEYANSFIEDSKGYRYLATEREMMFTLERAGRTEELWSTQWQ